MPMTNEQINKLTDAQINVMVEMHNYSDLNLKVVGDYAGIELAGEEGCFHEWGVSDYCNDPAAMWPIIDELTADGGIVQIARVGVILYPASGGSIDCLHKNKLRAAAIVYLKSKGVL